MFHPSCPCPDFQRAKEEPSEAPKPRASGRGTEFPWKDPHPPLFPGHAEGPPTLVAGLLTQAPGWASNGHRAGTRSVWALPFPWVRCFLSLAGLGNIQGHGRGLRTRNPVRHPVWGKCLVAFTFREAGCSRPLRVSHWRLHLFSLPNLHGAQILQGTPGRVCEPVLACCGSALAVGQSH